MKQITSLHQGLLSLWEGGKMRDPENEVGKNEQ